MSSAPHVSAFVKGVAKNKEIWTIQFPDKSYIKWEKDDGTEIFPVWSTKSRVEKIISYETAFEGASVVSFTYGEFLTDWVPQLIKDSTGLGPNWAGENVMGWEMEAKEIIGRIEHAIDESTKIT